MTPHPTELFSPITEEQVERYRHLDCKSYDACLTVAAQAHRSERTEWQSVYWASWTCTRCPLWLERETAKMDAAAVAERMDRRAGYSCGLTRMTT